MAKSDVLLGLIKEVVKNEVKQQLKEEIVKLVKSGAITITNKQNSNKLKDLCSKFLAAQRTKRYRNKK